MIMQAHTGGAAAASTTTVKCVRSLAAEALAAPASEGIIVLDTEFQPIALDCGAEEILANRGELPGGNGGGPIPGPLLNLMRSKSTNDRDGSPMYISANGYQYSCRAFDLRPLNGSEPMIVLYLRREVSLVDAVQQIATNYHLTDREQEALVGLSMGLTSKELAAKMKISPHTVKAFVRLAMIKTGAGNRAGLFAKLFDRTADRRAASG